MYMYSFDLGQGGGAYSVQFILVDNVSNLPNKAYFAKLEINDILL